MLESVTLEQERTGLPIVILQVFGEDTVLPAIKREGTGSKIKGWAFLLWFLLIAVQL